jgi:hypothetical protein
MATFDSMLRILPVLLLGAILPSAAEPGECGAPNR